MSSKRFLEAYSLLLDDVAAEVALIGHQVSESKTMTIFDDLPDVLVTTEQCHTAERGLSSIGDALVTITGDPADEISARIEKACASIHRLNNSRGNRTKSH